MKIGTNSMPVLAKSLRALLLATALAACTPTLTVHGQVPEPEKLEAIEPGVTSRSEVEQALGTPSTRSMFEDDVWYYTSEKTETVAFFHPDLIERKNVAIQLDVGGTVKDIYTYHETDGHDINMRHPVARQA